MIKLLSRRYTWKQIELARQLWDIEEKSASVIARELSLTKGIIVGIARRHGFKDRPSPIGNPEAGAEGRYRFRQQQADTIHATALDIDITQGGGCGPSRT